jgi:hypothetical protein
MNIAFFSPSRLFGRFDRKYGQNPARAPLGFTLQPRRSREWVNGGARHDIVTQAAGRRLEFAAFALKS